MGFVALFAVSGTVTEEVSVGVCAQFDDSMKNQFFELIDLLSLFQKTDYADRGITQKNPLHFTYMNRLNICF